MHRDERVTDAMVEKAARAMCEQGGYDPEERMPNDGPRWRYYCDGARAALSAALSEQTLPVRVEIKKLEWQTLAAQDRNAEVADSVLGRWEVWHFPAGKTYVMKPGEHQGTVFEDGLDEAKAHMERAYQRRMAPAIVDVPAVEPEPVAWLVRDNADDEFRIEEHEPEICWEKRPLFSHPPRSALVDNSHASEAVVESLDDRMKAAGMYTVSEMMGVTPLTKWMANPAINTIEAFSEWLDRKVSEYLRMKAAYDLGDKDGSDELYEWVQAHSAVYSTIRDQFQVVLSSLRPTEVGSATTTTGAGGGE